MTLSTRGSKTRRTLVYPGRDDQWKVGPSDELAFSGFFRTYNLALFSNFGEGLIRQSEFRTVEGAEARETHTFTPWLEAMAGLLYNEDDIHSDNLDHYLSDNRLVSVRFVKVLANNVTIREVAPYVACTATSANICASTPACAMTRSR